jgi:hypothetical protein
VLVASDDDAAGRGWGHTRADTIDKLQARDLRESAILLTALVARVAEAEVPRLDTEDLAAALERSGEAEAMRVTGDWPFEP